jgi:hypothetical protein
MTSVCFTPLKVPRVRVTLLDSCGQAVTGTCSTVVSDGIISIAQTKEYEDRQEFFVKNGDGIFCVRETNPPILKWINLVVTFCNVDPELVGIMTGNSLVADDSAAAKKIGYNEDENAATLSNFALEGWTRLANQGVACTGGLQYGYVLYPFAKEGTIGDITYQNDVVNFVVNARTSSNSLWGTGPYLVDLSDNAGTLDTPIPLLTPIGQTTHSRMFITRKAPPDASCGCQALYDATA